MKKMTSEELQKETENFLNSMCNTENEVKFIELMSRAHRTLQQSYTRFVMRWIGKMAMTEYFDGRNEASVKLCKKIINAVKDEDSLPLI